MTIRPIGSFTATTSLASKLNVASDLDGTTKRSTQKKATGAQNNTTSATSSSDSATFTMPHQIAGTVDSETATFTMPHQIAGTVDSGAATFTMPHEIAGTVNTTQTSGLTGTVGSLPDPNSTSSLDYRLPTTPLNITA